MDMTDVVEGMNADTITLADPRGVEARCQLANDYTALGLGNVSLRSFRIHVDLQVHGCVSGKASWMRILHYRFVRVDIGIVKYP